MSFAENILQFLTTLNFSVQMPAGIQVMNPYKDEIALSACSQFYKKYYNDDSRRMMIIGINPGRFGGGITGIPFTDPVRLENDCGISNPWPGKQELSSVYIYEMIQAYGGPAAFYASHYVSAISPLGFTMNGKNLNYYDDKALQENIKPFVLDCLRRQINFGINTSRAFCLGDGKNFRYLTHLNNEFNFFEAIVPLPHPRFIMQYRLKRKSEYIQYYLDKLTDHTS